MNILLLGLISFFTDVSSEMVYPLVPLFLTAKLGASPAVLGLVEGSVESLASLLKVFSGHLSDKYGRRKPIAFLGYATSFWGKVFLVLAGSWPMVFLARGFDRVGKGLRGAPRDALIAESAEPGKVGAAFGIHRLMDTLGAVVGISLAFVLLSTAPEHYTKVFMWSLLPALIALACFLPVKDKVVPKQNTKGVVFQLAPFRSLPADVKRLLMISFLFALGNSSNQFLLLRAASLGFLPAMVMLLYLVYNLSYALVSYSAGKLSDRIGRKPLLLGAFITYALVYAGFAVAKTPTAIWLLFVVYGFYAGAAEGVEKAFLVDLGAECGKATVLGWHGTLVGIALLPASLAAGILWRYVGPWAPFAFGTLMALIAFGALYKGFQKAC